MESYLFFKGMIIGLVITIPPGPIGVMCLRRTMAEGLLRGFVIGLGAAIADTLFSAIAAFGLTLIADIALDQYFWIRLAGGILLLFLGIRTLVISHEAPILPFRVNAMLGPFLTALVLALTNPLTIVAFAGIFTVFGLGHDLSLTSASLLVLGVFAGSCLWFLTLGWIAIIFGQRLHSTGLRWVHRIAGILIIVSGVAAFVTLFLPESSLHLLPVSP
ncbi:MAG: LysE family transporter [Ignavibacteria bacterium]|nr:LysE family transporter [Ignavibacteria bacterium]